VFEFSSLYTETDGIVACGLLSTNKVTVNTVSPTSGVTTDPADPAMRGAREPKGAQNCGISFFH